MSGALTSQDDDGLTGAGLCECPDCGLFQGLPRLRPGQDAQCLRCGAVLRRRRRDPFTTSTALMLAGLALWALALFTPLMWFRFAGQERVTSLVRLPFAYQDFGMPELTVVVLLTIVFAPGLKLALTGGVLIGAQWNLAPNTLATMARVRAWLTPWSMTEVFLLGMFVAYTRLAALARVEIGAGLIAMFGLMLVMVAADALLDEHAMWDAIRRRTGPPVLSGQGALIGCETCGQVSRAEQGETCPRCDSYLYERKPQPIARCWALLLAAAALYIPSNILPIMTVIRLGRATTSTIIGGVRELIGLNMWPLALLVFVASIAVPVIKLLLLAYLLIETQRGSADRLILRTRLYRFVDIIGRWSMIDVFMVTILTALVRMGTLGSVIPGDGVVCFCAVVILTMLASRSFDPRVMWDAAARRAGDKRAGLEIAPA